MSIKNDKGLIEKLKKYDGCPEVGAMKVTIRHDQVLEIVVADLIAKYRHCKKRDDEYAETFEKVLRYYLDDEEMEEIEAI